MKYAVHICGPEDSPYLASHEDALKRMKRGERQQQCPTCKLWIWPDKMPTHECKGAV